MTESMIVGPAARRGTLQDGERVQLTDAKGKMHTIQLHPGGHFHTHRGGISHDAIIGRPDGSVVTTAEGHEYLVLRPLLSDYVMGMPRGAAIVYPKDSGQVIQMADIFAGATVVEAGVGSGALSMSLLNTIGPTGRLIGVERRADFAAIAVENARAWFGADHPAWEVHVGDLADRLPGLVRPGSVDRVVLDMLAPWENIDVVAEALTPGGVVLAYVATTTQMSRFVEDLRESGAFTEPQAWESMVRTWHVEGLAVRPDHRMVGHTGFLVTARRLAPGTVPPARTRRPAPAAEAAAAAAAAGLPEAGPRSDADVFNPGEWSPADLGERAPSDKKTRRVLRDLRKRAAYDQEVKGAEGADAGKADRGESPEEGDWGVWL